MAKKEFPEWARIAYRGVRAAVGAGIAQVIVLRPDLTNPQEAAKVIALAFLAGFLPALGMWARDMLDTHFGYDEKSLVQRVMPL